MWMNGLAKASASRISSATRNANSSRYFKRRCLTELCVLFSKNISELNGSGVVLCRRSRCSQIGKPIARPPAKNQGVRNPTLHPPVPDGHILAQSFVEWASCVHQKIIHPRPARGLAEVLYMGVDPGAIFVAGV